jgi:predicted house-cleaning noncanonical NTP pyrophosphatase (MazG superfamily)
MRIFRQNKLWRDKAVEMLEQQGSRIHWQRLDDNQYDQELRIKLLEEAEEVRVATSPHELISELDDAMEVVESIAKLHNLALSDIKILQEKKQKERGGFEERKFVTTAEHPEGSFGEKYCLEAPYKYPEITVE